MIGESICLGRDGIHFDLFIKVGRLIGTLSPASRVPSALQSPKYGVPVAHTAGTTIISFHGGVPPRAPPLFIFFFKHV